MQRSYLLFENSIHSKHTLLQYRTQLDRFITFFKLKDYDSLARMNPKLFQQMVEDYVMMLKGKGLRRNTIYSPISALQLFCETNDVIINWKKIKRMLPRQGKPLGSGAYTTEHVAKMLKFTPDLRAKTIIHFLAATGVRVGAMPELRIKHIKEMPDGCKAIIVYPEDKEEYMSFLTPEASKALDEYLDRRRKDGEYLNEESPLFRQKYQIGIQKPKALSRQSFQAIIDRVLRRSGLRTGRTKERREIQLDHGFRKRWDTIMKTTDGMKIVLVEKMFGHSITIPLDETYLVPSIDKLFKEYKKAIPELTISNEERQQVIITKQQEDLTELEKVKLEQKKILAELERFKIKQKA